jgi:hypothetical protein
MVGLREFWQSARHKVVWLLLAAVTGCATQQTVAPPSTISLEKAMVDTVEAMAATRKRGLELGTNFQLYACTVTAVFTISATQTVDNKIAIQASAGPPAIPASVGGSASSENSSIGTRGNTVTVVLASNQCSPTVALKAANASTSGKNSASTRQTSSRANAVVPSAPRMPPEASPVMPPPP